MSTLAFDDLLRLRGKDLKSADGERIGSITEIYCDESTGEPEWIEVENGLFGMKRLLVPTAGAKADEQAGVVLVPYSKHLVTEEPAFDPDRGINAQYEKDLRAYFGLAERMGNLHRYEEPYRT